MLDVRTKIGEGGRVIIPLSLRKKLNLSIGDEVFLDIKEGELRLQTTDYALKRIQDKIRKHNSENISLVEALLTMRREETTKEEEYESNHS